MNWFKKFSEGRTGTDHFSLFLVIMAIFVWILSRFWQPLVWLGWLLILWSYYRTFSKNKLRRHQENIVFLRYWYPIQSRLVNWSRKQQAKREFRYFKCKSCKQKLRVPSKVKRVRITCPKCRHDFIYESLGSRIKNQGLKK